MPIHAPRYTVAQVRAFPPDGHRYELLDGVLLVTPAPRNLHQVVTANLTVMLHNALALAGMGRVVAPGELEIGDRTLLDPDILVYPSTYPPSTHWKRIREWWLAVEVLSPSSRVYDREFKRSAYQNIGVTETWLVDPDTKTIDVWRGRAQAGEVIDHHLLWQPPHREAPVEIRLAEVFRDI
ncbi:MAG: Uma2 family endonuclease [Gemmatimonadota bacterium]